ncbi:hypothetical protein MNEG_8600 [Monoraphidium neglectum]|uniref:DNAJ-containing protein X-domain domain-containing protein n=1 Tax=Monoraphidium neglectum TaxID=145388 RepID=A0A0D2KVE2_9CHLO|nr:hypothetical protein MNEG_8600 [Monoraphidium neglectum]KIY99358.1 hypothetical protein MNEG_8600 [Monoraphidium neglectum]|eukprot:XP_013898378.1 hypothetical protein MNEG_8600 [Monoraphidium neglectum]
MSSRRKGSTKAATVLSNPELRARYDRSGAEGLDQVDFMDGAAFFSALFGSELFDHLIGELAIATVAGAGGELDVAELRKAQAARVEQLAVNLKALLRRYVEGDTGGYELSQRCEAARLAEASFGDTLLHCIGQVYSMQSDIFLGGVLDGTWARVKQGRQTIRSHMDIAGAALRVMSHQEKVAEFDRECDKRRRVREQEAAAAAARRLAADARGGSGAGEGEAARWAPQPRPQGVGEGTGGRATAGTEAYGQGQRRQETSPAAARQRPSERAERFSARETQTGRSKGPRGGGGGGGGGSISSSSSAEALASDAPDSSGGAAGRQSGGGGGGGCESGGVPMEELIARSRLEDTSLNLVMEAMWAANVVDIQATLSKVCRRVLHDKAAGKAVCRKRAQGLRLAGEIFQSAAASQAASPSGGGGGGGSRGGGGGGRPKRDAKEAMERAFLAVMERRMAADAEEDALAAAGQ